MNFKEGTHLVTIVSAHAEVTYMRERDVIKVRLENQDGARMPWGFVIVPESKYALRYFYRHMAAFGLTEDYFAANPTLEAVASDLLGRRAIADVTHTLRGNGADTYVKVDVTFRNVERHMKEEQE